ncbi:hypothetical protein ACFWPU_00810 [Streptomyces sp. NPDC058471]|uniref:hypothetical protein n=1 Tax=Streptomyces sp. NPDC058471 TaxID=3346516 RepID=UPI0036480037
MTEPLDTEWSGIRIYVQPGGCVELDDTGDSGEGAFIHLCEWGGLVDAVAREIDRVKPYRDPRNPEAPIGSLSDD